VGIRESDTPYLILLNNDTKVKSSFIKSLYGAIQRDEKIFSVSAKMLMWDQPELIDDAGDRYSVLGWAYARGKGKPAAAYDRPVEIFSACGGAAIYRRSILDEIGLFDELHFAYLEDVDLGYRARIQGYRNFYEPGAEVLHFGSASTGSRYNPRKTLLAAANSVYVVYKNMPLLQLVWNLPFLLVGFLAKWMFFCRKKMGSIYLRGLAKGVKRCFNHQGHAHKIPFQKANFWHYLRIQWELYVNFFRFFGAK
jgi:GT2 family glycosyltransferase